MKILQVVHSLPFLSQGGTEIYTYSLCNELAKKHKVYIFTRECNTRQKEYAVTKRNIGETTVFLLNNTFLNCNSFKMYYANDAIDSKFAEALDEVKPDIVHIQHLIFLSIGIIKEIKKRGIPIVFTLHDYWLMCPKWHLLKNDLRPCNKAEKGEFGQECLDCLKEIIYIQKGAKKGYVFIKRLLPVFMVNALKKLYCLYMKKISDNGDEIIRLKERELMVNDLLNMVDVFLSPSEFLKNKFETFAVPADKIRLSRLDLNSSLFTDIQKTKSDKIRFAFIGTILPAKGLHILIEAFNRIRKDDAELKIYGYLHRYTGFEYYPSYLKRIAKNKNIIFKGEFNHSDILNIFKEIDVLVVPSLWEENSPLVIQEAISTKTPVIASRLGGIPELVVDGVTGLLFAAGNTGELKEKIEYVINDPHVLERFQENLPRISRIQDNTKELEAYYAGLIPKENHLLNIR